MDIYLPNLTAVLEQRRAQTLPALLLSLLPFFIIRLIFRYAIKEKEKRARGKDRERIEAQIRWGRRIRCGVSIFFAVVILAALAIHQRDNFRLSADIEAAALSCYEGECTVSLDHTSGSIYSAQIRFTDPSGKNITVVVPRAVLSDRPERGTYLCKIVYGTGSRHAAYVELKKQ